MSDAAAKQRLMTVIVGEVSLVDMPANECDFLTVKNTDGAAGAPTATHESQPETQLMHIAQETAQTLNKSVADFIAAVEKAAKEGDGDKKMPPWMKEEMKKLLDTVKAFMGEDASAAENITLSADGTVLAKGLKQFSKERVSKLIESFKSLATMVKEVDSEGFASAVAAFSPATSQPMGSAGQLAPAVKAAEPAPVVAPAPKADEVPAWAAQLTATIGEINKNLTGVAARVEAVEKGQAGTKSLAETPPAPKPGEEIGPDGKPVTKSFWKGVL